MLVTLYLSLSYCMIYNWILEWFDWSSSKPDPNEIVDKRSLQTYSIKLLVYYAVGSPLIYFPFPYYDCNCYNVILGVIRHNTLLPLLKLV